MSLLDWVNNNLQLDNPFLCAIELGILWLVVYDFYHLLFSSVLTWFRK